MASLFELPPEVRELQKVAREEVAQARAPVRSQDTVNALREQMRQNKVRDWEGLRQGIGNIGQGLFPESNMSPELKRFRDIESIRKAVNSKYDFGTAEYFDEAAKRLAAAGYTREAYQAKQAGLQFAVQESEIIKNKATAAGAGKSSDLKTLTVTNPDTGETKTVTLNYRDPQQAALGNRLTSTGMAVESVKPDTLVEITNKGDETFNTEMSKLTVEQVGEYYDAEKKAVNQEIIGAQLADIWTRGVETGIGEKWITPLQNVSRSIGFDLDYFLESNGIKMGDLSDKEQFNKLASQMVVQSFEYFKGNLNKEEVRIAEEGQVNLGDDEETNLATIATYLTSAEMAQQTAGHIKRIQGELDIAAFEKDKDGYIAARKKLSEAMNNPRSGKGQQFVERKKEIMRDLRIKRSVSKAREEGYTVVGTDDTTGFPLVEVDGERYVYSYIPFEDFK